MFLKQIFAREAKLREQIDMLGLRTSNFQVFLSLFLTTKFSSTRQLKNSWTILTFLESRKSRM